MPTNSSSKKINDGVVFHDSKGRVRLGMGVNENDQPAIIFLDEQGATRILISTGDKDVPCILFYDEKGKETLALSDFLIRIGKIGEDNIQIDRAKSKTAITIAGKKGKAILGLLDGEPCFALSDGKDVNSVGMVADEKHAEVAIMHKNKYIWTAESANGKLKK
jgi:hypothetical protein